LLRQSLAIHATNPRTHHQFATLYHEQGKFAEALECYERILVLSPDDAEARFLAAHWARIPRHKGRFRT
jgi:cytochrome c-type biogenesis protein CcmH/NrfG